MKRFISLMPALAMISGVRMLSGCGKDKVTGVSMAEQVYSGSNIYEIPQFDGESKEAVMLNVNIYERMAPYITGWETIKNDETYWYEIKSYPICDKRYRQVVVTALELPNYGTDGDVFSFCYDSRKNTVLTLDDALAQANVSRETAEHRIGQLMTGYLYEGDLVVDISFPAFIFAGGELCLIARAFVENDLASEHDELYVYNTARDTLSDYTGGCLIPAGLCDQLQPPLNYARGE